MDGTEVDATYEEFLGKGVAETEDVVDKNDSDFVVFKSC